MARLFPKAIIVLFAFAGMMGLAQAQGANEPVFHGRPLSSWIASIHDRDEDIDQAFRAVQSLGPIAFAAVPELTNILNEPFDGIRVGVDNDAVISQKLWDMQLRSDAVDSLGAIGSASASAAASLIKWALTKRVYPESIETDVDYETFVDLVALDVLERIRVVNVISLFRLDAAPAILALINSSDTDERKLAVAILQSSSLSIAAELLKSDDCKGRKLGVRILLDLWSVVPTEHLQDLRIAAECPLTAQQSPPPQ